MKLLMYFIITFFSLFIPTAAYAINSPNIVSDSYVLYDLTENKIYLSKNIDKKNYIASLTKMMTVMTAIKLENNLDRKIIINQDMFSDIDPDASVVGLKINDEVSIRDLLYATMLPSGADAANALAVGISGSLNNFIANMNKFAKEIGMNSSHFVNTHGLDRDNHYSTVNDLLILLKYALKNDTFKNVYTAKKYVLSNNKKVHATIGYYSKHMNVDLSWIKGCKTGFTDLAGLCLSYYFESNTHEFIAITLGVKNDHKSYFHIRDALTIHDFVNNNYNVQKLVKKGDVIDKVKVTLSSLDEIDIKSPKTVTKYLANDYDLSKVNVYYKGKDTINFNYDIKDPLGTVYLFYDGSMLLKEDIYLKNKLPVSLKKIIIQYKYLLLSYSILIIVLIYLIILIKKKKKSSKK